VVAALASLSTSSAASLAAYSLNSILTGE
jgi:hypothetical protein